MKLLVRAFFLIDSGMMPKECSRPGTRTPKRDLDYCSGLAVAAGIGVSDAREDKEDYSKGRKEEETDDVAANEDHEQPAEPEGNAVIDLYGVVRQHIAQQVTAIERWNRKQVEDKERKVDLDCGNSEKHESLHTGIDAGQKHAAESVEHDFAATGSG